MVTLNKLYTKTGDKGETHLGDLSRVHKTDPLVQAYGTADELNAVVGMARLFAEGDTDEALARIQNELFDLGADLCTPFSKDEENKLRIISSQTERLEIEIDEMTVLLKPLNSFILPGGSPLAAHLHHARTVARRTEREILSVKLPINEETIRYVNRLSDWFFAAARIANENGNSDVLWTPGASRT